MTLMDFVSAFAAKQAPALVGSTSRSNDGCHVLK